MGYGDSPGMDNPFQTTVARSVTHPSSMITSRLEGIVEDPDAGRPFDIAA
jgi:hypothetical protein